MNDELTASKPAHPEAVKDFWLSTVRPLADRGALDTIKPIRATTPRLRDVARTQNQALTRRVFGSFGPNYDRINWGKCGCGDAA
jgi:hypothetical protein